MTLPSRRSLLKAGAAGLAVVAAPAIIFKTVTAQSATLIRYDVATPEGQAMLTKYSQAIAIMRARTTCDPESWNFQFYTHRVRGDRSKSNEVRSCPSSRRPLANEMWNTCQNHSGQTSQDMFLPWHRMYVYYMERILRDALQDPAFTLPYWNYTNAATASIPAAFRTPAATSNPLYSRERNSGPNSGTALTNLNLNALNQTTYSGFCQTLDFGLHGAIHVQVGNRTRGMGVVPWAANDPLFWLHHCNIDRLWTSWNAGNPANVNPATTTFLNQTFIFADELGARTSNLVSGFTEIAPLGYAYDRLEPLPGAPVTPVAPAGGPQARVVGPTRKIDLGSGPTQLKVELPSSGEQSPAELRKRVRNLKDKESIQLLVEGLSAKQQPGVVYDIYLNLPATVPARAPEQEGRPYLVGTINFFAAVMPEDMGHHSMPAPSIGFDVTRLLKLLASRNMIGNALNFTIVPNGRPAADAQASIRRMTLVQA